MAVDQFPWPHVKVPVNGPSKKFWRALMHRAVEDETELRARSTAFQSQFRYYYMMLAGATKDETEERYG